MTRRLAIVGMGKMGRRDRRARAGARLGGRRTTRRGRHQQRHHQGDCSAAPTSRWSSRRPAAAPANIRAIAATGCPVVVGTTGWYDADVRASRPRSQRVGGALLTAANFSLGVNIFEQIVEVAARQAHRARAGLRGAHHRDASRGQEGRAVGHGGDARAGGVERRAGDEIPITSIRVGSVPGTHEVVFDAPFEQIHLEHVARDRRVFAEGALVAAAWLIGKRGVFTMRDVLTQSCRQGHDHDGDNDSPAAARRSSRRSIRDGAIDEAALRALVDWQIEEGIHFLVPCGSTGEAATMTVDEHRRVVEIVVEQASGRVPVVAGAGSNDTQKAIALSKAMRDAGATHLLHTSPMYNKPPQRGIVAHYRAIAEAVDLPIVVYNVPGRTGSNIEAKTTLEMAKIPRHRRREGGVGTAVADRRHPSRARARSSPSCRATTRSRFP